MNRKRWIAAALVAALCLALTGCNLIGVDPLMQIAVSYTHLTLPTT